MVNHPSRLTVYKARLAALGTPASGNEPWAGNLTVLSCFNKLLLNLLKQKAEPST